MLFLLSLGVEKQIESVFRTESCGNFLLEMVILKYTSQEDNLSNITSNYVCIPPFFFFFFTSSS